MAVTQNKAVFPQTPKSAGIAFAAGSNSTQMDPGTVTPTTLVTAGANGALVTGVIAHAEATVTADKLVFWVQLADAGSWYAVKSVVLAAYTQAATDAQGSITAIDKEKPDAAIRLAATDVLGVTHHVDNQLMVLAEYMDY